MARSRINSLNSTASKSPIIAIIVFIVIVLILSRFFVTIPAGHAGVVTQFGRVVGRVLEPGLNWMAPWRECHTFDCRIQKYEGKTECFSKDLQLVTISVTFLYSLPIDNSQTVFAQIGPRYIDQIIPRVWEALKQHVAQYEAEAIVGKREELRLAIISTCKERFSEIVDVNDVVMTNISFSEVYEKAIEQKQVAQQEALRAKYELDRSRTEAEKTIELARGEAEAIRIKGQALRDNPGAVQLEAIQKWNGVSPQTVVLGNGDGVPVVFPVK